MEAMSDPSPADLAGIELAGELLPGGRHALLAFLVSATDGGAALELGTWAVAEGGKLARPARPLVVPAKEVDRVRALVQGAAATLNRVPHGQADGPAELGRDGELTLTTASGPDGAPWATLGRADAGGLVAVPAAALASLVRVLAEAERQLAELGLVALAEALPKTGTTAAPPR
jgi:hypothetical protein